MRGEKKGDLASLQPSHFDTRPGPQTVLCRDEPHAEIVVRLRGKALAGLAGQQQGEYGRRKEADRPLSLGGPAIWAAVGHHRQALRGVSLHNGMHRDVSGALRAGREKRGNRAYCNAERRIRDRMRRASHAIVWISTTTQ